MTIRFKSDQDRSLFIKNECSNNDISDKLINNYLSKRLNLINKFSLLEDFNYNIPDSWFIYSKDKELQKVLSRYLTMYLLSTKLELIDKSKFIKAISSVITHLYTELEYYRFSIDDDINYHYMLRDITPKLLEIINQLNLNNFELSREQFDLLLKLTHKDKMALSISQNLKYDFIMIQSYINSIIPTNLIDYVELYNKVIKLCQDNGDVNE